MQKQRKIRTHVKPVALSAATNTILLRPYPRKRSSNQGISRREMMPHGSYRLQYSIWYGSCADVTPVLFGSWVRSGMALRTSRDVAIWRSGLFGCVWTSCRDQAVRAWGPALTS